MPLLHPPYPICAKTHPFPGFVLGSSKSSTYPTWERSLSRQVRGGWVKNDYASGFNSPAALLRSHFEHPPKAYYA